MPPRRRKRLDPAVFNFPVDQIKQGYYTDAYFVRAREIVRTEKRSPNVMMQFSGKRWGWLEAQAASFVGKAVGTIPHALIAALGGDTVKATKRFCEVIEGVDVIALVDYDNDSVKTSLDVAREVGDRLWGVRLDTAENLV